MGTYIPAIVGLGLIALGGLAYWRYRGTFIDGEDPVARQEVVLRGLDTEPITKIINHLRENGSRETPKVGKEKV